MAQILLIDDDGDFRGVVCKMLERAGHTVMEAPTGRQAITLLKVSSLPDLVVTDLLMPQMDGIEFLQYVRGIDAGVRVLAMSGGGRLGPGDLLEASVKLGADRAIAKPFGRAEFLRLVADLLTERAGPLLPTH